MKQLISSTLFIGMFVTACSSGDNQSGSEGHAADSSAYESVSNDSLDRKLKKAEELVKDDSTTTDEDDF
jgi:hypothetical protein